MASQSKSLTGARTKLFVNGQLAGVFNSTDYNVNYGTEPVYVLGNYGPQELAYTSQSVVSVTCSGIRVLDNGPYSNVNSVPALQDLLRAEDISLVLVDRRSGKVILNVSGVRPTGYSSATSTRALHDLTVNFVGLTIADENTPNGQSDPGGTQFG